MAKELLDVLTELRDERRPHAVATVIETVGSSSAKTGAKAVIDQHGQVLIGWVGGGCAESATCQAALACMDSGDTTIVDIDLDDEVLGVGMPCGGSMRVYVEPMLPRPALWIVGHGRVAESLCLLADLVGLDVVVNDPSADRSHYPAAKQLIVDDLDYAQLQPGSEDYVVIATQHKGDHESIQRVLASDAAYIALIASRKRSKLVLDYLQQEGVDAAQLTRVRAPAGLDLGARTPEEIALCIISEIVLERRKGSGQSMRDKQQATPVPAQAATP